ncbi:MAG: tandem-95 repeat protein [Caldilinea sp. CFX5]|nr:tandem-95 repeat protein [Caldilinea sp. CFX5]
MKWLLSTFVMVFEFLRSAECRIWLRLAVKPLVVLAVLALFLWLGAWFDTQIANHIAHAESTEIQGLACLPGTEQDGALCYTPCQEGFTGAGPICYKKCPDDYTDDGAICRKNAHIFAKASYGRGGGSSMICAPNQEAQGGLCYPRCAPTHYGVGPVCWERCKAGYADHGVTCFKHLFDLYGKNTYGRGAGVGVSACPAGMERNGALCYPRCQAGFSGAGPVCFQICPAGYKDDGALCRKDAIIFAKESYPRGAGEAMNFAPEAFDETVRTPKDTPVRLERRYIDLNDFFHSIVTVKTTSHGTTIAGLYTPNSGFEGVDTYHWKIGDGKHDSNVAIATIIVGNGAANSAPVALDRTVVVTEETPITIDVLCTDAENDELFYQLLEKPKHGEYQWIPPNTVIYTPTVDFVGTDSFTFRSHDGQDSSNVSTITLTVNAVNDAPVIVTQPISTTRNNNAAVTLAATDAEGDAITYTVVSSPTYGSLSGAIPNLLYTPNAHYVGEDSFQFRASDAQGAATVATVNITVLPTNTAPVVENLALSTTQESAIAVNLTATDADGDALTYRLVSSPTHGSLAGEGTDWVYTPNAGFIGVESFTFTANDGQVDAPVATVTITVNAGPNEASVAGLVFEDRNGNGQPDADDVGVAGLLVTLTPSDGRAGNALSTTTESGGGWRIDNVPFGQYTVKVAAGNGAQIEQPVAATVTVGQRGLQQLPPGAVKVTSRALFLPVVVR